MNVSTKLLLLPILAIFIMCNSITDNTTPDQKVSVIDPDNIPGIWREVSFASEIDSFKLHDVDIIDELWKFTEDSLYILKYARNVMYDLKWDLDGSNLLFSGVENDTIDYYWILNSDFYISFSNDTLVIKQINQSSHIGENISYHNYMRVDTNLTAINNLVYNRINWSQFRNEWFLWQYDGDSEIKSRNSMYNLSYPDRLDLRATNEMNFEFHRDTLIYGNKSEFKFLFLNQFSEADGMALELLNHDCPQKVVLVYSLESPYMDL